MGTTCPDCRHDRGEKARRTDSVWHRLLRRPPRPASCTEPGDEDLTGWGAADCGCTHPFHGS